MKKLLRGFKLICLLTKTILISNSISPAQSSYQDEILNELKDYARQNIRPVLIAQRDRLDEELTLEEQEKINDLRIEFQEIVEMYLENKIKVTPNIKLDEIILIDHFYSSVFLNSNLFRPILNDVREIIDKRSEVINLLMKEIIKNTNKWHHDMELIVNKLNKRNKRKVAKTVFDQQLDEIIRPELFLLWDERGIYFDYSVDDYLAESFTNPTLQINNEGNQVIVQMNLTRPSHLYIRLFNQKGKLLQSIEKYFDSMTLVEEAFDLSRQGSGAYFVRIITETDSHLIRFFKD